MLTGFFFISPNHTPARHWSGRESKHTLSLPIFTSYAITVGIGPGCHATSFLSYRLGTLSFFSPKVIATERSLLNLHSTFSHNRASTASLPPIELVPPRVPPSLISLPRLSTDSRRLSPPPSLPPIRYHSPTQPPQSHCPSCFFFFCHV